MYRFGDVRCEEAREILLAPAATEGAAAVRAHVATCHSCAAVDRRAAQLDRVLGASLVVEPPLALQTSLLQIARAAAIPAPVSAPVPETAAVSRGWLRVPSFGWVHAVAATSVAAASWQVIGWVQRAPFLLGDVQRATDVLLTNQAWQLLGAPPVPDNVVSLAAWSALGGGAWLLSRAGLLERSPQPSLT